ncbi:hypothetical protein [Cytobacillus sp.]|uniref:hypothetical protein n=1 Tax=Cytobacillus sp. TaxID=2675269 RepID=UPI0035173D61
MNQPLGWFFVWDREKKEDLLLVKKIRAETGRIKGGVRAQTGRTRTQIPRARANRSSERLNQENPRAKGRSPRRTGKKPRRYVRVHPQN